MSDQDRNYLVQQLAYQVLHQKWDGDGNPLKTPTPGIEQVGTGDVRLDLEIRGMVSNMRRQIWVDQGAWTKKIMAEIERQAAEIDVNAIITNEVRGHLNVTLRDLEKLITAKVNEYITSAVYDRIESLRGVVRDIAEKLIKKITKAAI